MSPSRPVVLCVFGTRPEAIKMAPVVKLLQESCTLSVQVCVTAQHRGMLDQVMDVFGLKPTIDLDLMREDQSLADVSCLILRAVDEVLERVRPVLVLVHGDTTTTMAASLAAYYRRIPVGHVEAGLRTGNIYAPWPEEINRRVTGLIASLHFAPTGAARDNLVGEGVVPDRVVVTGNTVIDALTWVVNRIENEDILRIALEDEFGFLDRDKRTVLVTGHRRENFGDGLVQMCRAIREIAARPDVQVVYPVHLNPKVSDPVHKMLGGVERVYLLPPLDYLRFVFLMNEAYLIVTDSGGIQEEAPALGKPVLVARESTERPEAVRCGAARLVGADSSSIVAAARVLLDDDEAYLAMTIAGSPYGDGHAAERIVSFIEAAHAAGWLDVTGEGSVATC